jgi:hypothetical protein
MMNVVPADPDEPALDRDRLAAVERATEVWKGQLVDLGGRNTLLYYKDLTVGTLDLSPGSGASYHTSPTARDRDRLRQEHLERLGWRFHRIWSIDWFRHRDAEIARAVAAYRAAVDAADSANDTRPVEPEAPWPQQPVAPDPPPCRRGPIPVRPGLGTITAYTRGELVALIRWLESDTLLRTEEDLISEATTALGFHKRGRNIVTALHAAIEDARRQDRAL